MKWVFPVLLRAVIVGVFGALLVGVVALYVDAGSSIGACP